MALRNLDGRSLVPNAGPALNALLTSVGTKQQRDEVAAERAKQAEIQDLSVLAPSITGLPRQKSIARLTSLDPQVGRAILALTQSGDKQAIAAALAESEKGGRQSAFISKQPDFASKQRALTSLAEEAAARGEPLDRFIELQNLSEPELDLELQRMGLMAQDLKTALSGPAAGDFAKAPGVITRNEDGSVSFEIPVLDKNTGTFVNKVVPISGEVVSRLGETGAEQSLRLAGQAGDAAFNRLTSELEVSPKITKAEKDAAALAAREQGIINRGLDAADTVPILSRSIELLNSVETGGFDAAALRAKKLFGIESADEAELSANLGKTVLSQLRNVFGAAFTEREGARLAAIEAGFGKSVAGNKRLLLQTKRIAVRAAERAIKVAERLGDTDTADEIRDMLSFSLNVESGEILEASQPAAPVEAAAPSAVPEGTTATNPATGAQVIFRGGTWQPL